MSDFKIRPAVVDDCVHVLGFVKQLAEYEKMADKVHLDLETFKEDGFGKEHAPRFYCLVAENCADKSIMGYSLYFYSYSTFDGKSIYMEDIFVDPNHRKKGVATALLSNLCKFASENGFKRIDFAILKWNELSINFHKSFGAVNISQAEDWEVYRLNDQAIKKGAEKASS